jgi:hypothetical protein
LVLVALLAQPTSQLVALLWERVEEILVHLALEPVPLQLQTQVAVVVAVAATTVPHIRMLAVLVVQAMQELCIGVKNGTTLRIS